MKLKAKAYLKIAAKKPIKNWRDKYDYVENFSEGLYKVKLDDKWGFVDEKGKEVVSPKYDGVGPFYEGLAKVKLEGKWGFIDKQDNIVIPLKYDSVYSFHGGLAVVRFGDTNTGKLGFVNQQGEEVVEPKYDMVGNFYEGFSKVKLEDQWGFVDRTGKEVIPCVYDDGDLPERKNIPSLSLQIREKYERDPEGLELVCPEFDWKAWYEQVTK